MPGEELLLMLILMNVQGIAIISRPGIALNNVSGIALINLPGIATVAPPNRPLRRSLQQRPGLELLQPVLR